MFSKMPTVSLNYNFISTWLTLSTWHRETQTSTSCPITSESTLHSKQGPRGDDKSKKKKKKNRSSKQLVGSRLQSKWEFLSRKNNETVYFYCILNEKSIDPPCVPVALYLQHNNRTAANSGFIWKKERRKAIYRLKMWSILCTQIIKVEWSCNCCLRKITSTPSSSQKTPIFDLLGVWLIQ